MKEFLDFLVFLKEPALIFACISVASLGVMVGLLNSQLKVKDDQLKQKEDYCQGLSVTLTKAVTLIETIAYRGNAPGGKQGG
jgi:hypothetical protein